MSEQRVKVRLPDGESAGVAERRWPQGRREDMPDIKTVDEETVELEGFEVFEIHPECRYAVVVKETLPDEIVGKLSEMLKQWLLSGDKFLIINGDVALARLNGTEKVDD